MEGGGQAHRVPTTVGGGGARGNSKTDRYSNVTSLELNYNQAKRMRGDRSVQQGASNLLSTCEIAAGGMVTGREVMTAGSMDEKLVALVGVIRALW